MLLERLKLWIERLVRIRLESARLRCELADLGVIPKAPFAVGSDDGPKVIRLKERLMAAHREKGRIVAEMTGIGAEILDDVTLEIVFPRGPGDDTVLSWMPGESSVGFWRERRDVASKRRPIPNHRRGGISPTRH
jgi:hypothetical protein